MARIYYKEEKIYGQPIETSVINLKNFKILMESSAPLESLMLAPNESGNYSDWFKNIQRCTHAQHWNAGKEGDFYLPKALIFYDVNDFVFPSLFYFIAQIGEQLEIRSVKGGKSVEWFHISDLHQPVNDESIIRKMGNSISSFLEFLKDYKEPEKPKAPRIQGTVLNLQVMEKLLFQLNVPIQQAPQIAAMAESPSDYFDANQEQLKKYQILDPSKNMYLLYLVSILEESKTMTTVDWKEEYSDVLYALNKLSGLEFENIDSDKYKRSTAGKILSALNKQVENKTNNTIFCVDTDSDSYSFGLIEKNRLKELIKTGKELGIKVYQPKK